MISESNDNRFFWAFATEKYKTAMEYYTTFRPLILLPFNIWFFFVSLPFRIFFAVTSSVFSKPEQIKEKKETETTQKKKDNFRTVEKTDSRAEEGLRRRSPVKEESEETQSEEKPRELVEEPEEQVEESNEEVEEDDSMSRIEELEKQIQAADEEKTRLEKEHNELYARFQSDERALADSEKERQRYKQLINVEQKKCFDFQQTIIALKNQIKAEHESRVEAEGKFKSFKRHTKKDKQRAKKEAAKLSASTEQTSSAQSNNPLALDASTHGMWHTPSTKGFTEMVAEAQKEELSHPKGFADILKQSIHAEEVQQAPQQDSKPEFVVVGGDLSTRHVVEAPSNTQRA